jgi:fatty-acyl-CoA synthase
MQKALKLDRNEDVLVSWLPLSHDMGLAGVLATAMTLGMELVIADPSTYLVDPTRWLLWCADYRGTLAVAPNISYSIAERQLKRSATTVDLSSLRLCVNGAEPIDVDSFGQFMDTAGAHGLTPTSAMCVYGLAEATLAVSFAPLGAGLEFDEPAQAGMSWSSRKLAMVGPPLSGLELRISSTSSRPLIGRDVGEIEVRGPSITPGYVGDYRYRGIDSWLQTGDLGYLHNGQLVVCGRKKEMIIKGGQNIFPEHLEAVISQVNGVKEGTLVVFGVARRNTEAIVAIIEAPDGEHGSLKKAISSCVFDNCQVSLDEILIVDAGTLPKTTSGKLARSQARLLFEAGSL